MGLPLTLKGSSWIESADYSIPDQKLTVVANGKEYVHENITPDVAFAFEAADSPGQFYNDKLKANTESAVDDDAAAVATYEVFVKSANVEGTLTFSNTAWSDVAFRLADFDKVEVLNVKSV